MPEVNSRGEKLELPTVVEAALFSRVMPMQKLFVVQASNRPRELRPSAVQASGLAFTNANSDVLRERLPMRASDLKDFFTVLCVDVCKDREELCKKVAQAKPLQVGQYGVNMVAAFSNMELTGHD